MRRSSRAGAFRDTEGPGAFMLDHAIIASYNNIKRKRL